jgi:hypothetical protein
MRLPLTTFYGSNTELVIFLFEVACTTRLNSTQHESTRLLSLAKGVSECERVRDHLAWPLRTGREVRKFMCVILRVISRVESDGDERIELGRVAGVGSGLSYGMEGGVCVRVCVCV